MLKLSVSVPDEMMLSHTTTKSPSASSETEAETVHHIVVLLTWNSEPAATPVECTSSKCSGPKTASTKRQFLILPEAALAARYSFFLFQGQLRLFYRMAGPVQSNPTQLNRIPAPPLTTKSSRTTL